MFVVGDLGRASLYSIKISDSITGLSKAKKANPVNVYTGGKIKDYKWEQLRPWFRAHDIGRMESTYVN